MIQISATAGTSSSHVIQISDTAGTSSSHVIQISDTAGTNHVTQLVLVVM